MPTSPEPVQITLNGLLLTLNAVDLGLSGIDYHGERWVEAQGKPCWQLLAVDEGGQRVLLDGAMARDTQFERVADGGAVLRWSGVVDAATGAGPFDVRVELRPFGDQPGAGAWRIAVDNQATAWTLWHVAFPILPGLRSSAAPENDQLFHPEGWGKLETGWAAMPDLKRVYPMGWNFTMQFLGLTRGAATFYLGVHDPALALKDFIFHPVQREGSWQAELSVTNYPAGMSTAGNGYWQEYDTVVAVLPGDWYDAAQCYGAWGRTQPWAVSPPAGSPSAPRTAREVQAWQLIYYPKKTPEVWAAEMARLAELCGVRLGIHFYHWHEIPFDTSYPDYFPYRDGFPELVARVQALGIVAMPYINARLWDINAPSWPMHDAERWAAKQTGARLHPISRYPHLEDYGNGQKHAVMCPLTPFWQQSVRNLCDRIVNEVGCDAVYLDQIAAANAVPCFDAGHGHAPGGGDFWLAGYRALLAGVRRIVGPEAYLTTECNWEGCIADVDALLMWHTFGDGLIPLFPAVYAGVARTFGCQFARFEDEENGQTFARRMAMLLVWGAQLGWGDLTQLLAPGREALLDYFVRLCRLRAAHTAIFAAGRLLRPPLVEGPALASLWAGEGGKTLFLVNPSPAPAQVTVRLAAGETPVVDEELEGYAVRAIGV